MDSLTQIVLGAAVGEMTMGRKIGNKAQLFGAIAGTIPDLDIILNFIFPDDLSKILIHRSYSHALLTHVLLAIPLAWWCFIKYKRQFAFNNWYKLWFLGLSTHALLDACTTYGTRLFLPFTDYQVGLNNISVIDPMYTFPFMGLLMVCLFKRRDDPNRRKWAKLSIYVSSAYMLLTFGVKWYVHEKFNTAWVKNQNEKIDYLYTSPTFFNNALWAGIATNDSFLMIGEYSVFEEENSSGSIEMVKYKRNLHLEKGFEGKGIETLKWFSQGKYILEMKDSNKLMVYITKWGRSDFSQTAPEKAFVFYYEIDKSHPDDIKAIQPEFNGDLMKQALSQLWRRIWSKEI
jgi:inner membrane protein